MEAAQAGLDDGRLLPGSVSAKGKEKAEQNEEATENRMVERELADAAEQKRSRRLRSHRGHSRSPE
jgi:hypothetical protein